MRNLMGDDAEEDFIFEDGFYPRLRHMDERPGRLAASPILLYPGENADSVTLPFYVDTNYGVRWCSMDENIIKIEGNIGYVRHPVLKETTVRVEAWKEDFSKHVYLDVPASNYVYQDLMADTVCPGDSVKMINSYARNEGWNYEVVETASAEYDTIYRMYLHHLPTYNLTYTDSCYLEELPYRVEGVQMESFGNKTERYVTKVGCDSVREYELLRRWHHYRVSVRVKGAGTANITDTVLREDGSLWLDFTASSCHKLDSLRIDGKTVPPQNRYLLQNLHGDCTVEAVFGSVVPTESVLHYEVCSDSLPAVYNGEAYGAGEHKILLRNAAGCDSVVRLQVQGKENVARIAVLDTIAPPCGASEISFSYTIETGLPQRLRLAFDPAALSAGFRDTVLAVGSTGLQTVRMALPATVHPDRYGLQLWQVDGTGCYVAEDALSFEIPYPSNIIVQKWSDVLAVLSAEYNGGYEFSGYQWFRNGEPIEGETRPYYYAKPYLRSGDTYAVLLERASDGLKLPSCGVKRKGYPRGFSLELLPNPVTAGEAVQVSVEGKPNAEGTIEVFDGIGKPVYQRAFRRSHTLRLSVQPGSYVVRVRDGKGSWTATGKLVVQ
ncbi:MAG: T9SS type A sorting domain-containing protein [Bacteroidales bacterium]|nr:T9SS type A sorting domain-containing protein [Bacteroidales bacterium]